MTTGGNHEAEIKGQAWSQDYVRPTEEGQERTLREVRPSIKEDIDVRLHTQAHLQAQGGTPTETTEAVAAQLRALDSRTPNEEAAPRGLDGTVVALICAYPWPQGCDYWVGIAWCESTLGQDPNAYADWNPYVGLFQIWMGHNYERRWLEDDTNNVLAAWELSHEGTRTSPWPYCQ